ncbi:MAG: hypothetical protein JWM82_4513, partial [Myxococcales bacterium]|nr:hypothetical protein [Myxococcales bacterium]
MTPVKRRGASVALAAAVALLVRAAPVAAAPSEAEGEAEAEAEAETEAPVTATAPIAPGQSVPPNGPVERLSGPAFPEWTPRGLPGGSLWLSGSMHGMPWPYTP